MQRIIPNLDPAQSIGLHIVVHDSSQVQQVAQFIHKLSEQISVTFTPWSLENQHESLHACDCVVVPIHLKDAAKLTKTANRLITSLAAGKPCLAQPIDSYQPFEASCFIHEDPLIAWQQYISSTPEQLLDKIHQGQALINDNYSMNRIGEHWHQLLLSISDQHQATQHQALNAKKLNLGCGDKILPGYMNVDVAQERNRQQPDVIADIRDLSVFEDNSVDEILSVHVIEHFYYWEAAPLLQEWQRVLKPGGKIIVECPNLIQACRHLLTNPTEAALPGPSGQKSTWALYGDPAHQDPLMCHKWPYTPYTLAQLMTQVGFQKVSQAQAMFKLRDFRDMRLVGYKES